MTDTWVIEKNFGGTEGWVEMSRRTNEAEAQARFDYHRAFTAPEIEMRMRKLEPLAESLDEGPITAFRAAVVKEFTGSIQWNDLDSSVAPALARSVVAEAMIHLLGYTNDAATESVMNDHTYDTLESVPQQRPHRRTSTTPPPPPLVKNPSEGLKFADGID